MAAVEAVDLEVEEDLAGGAEEEGSEVLLLLLQICCSAERVSHTKEYPEEVNVEEEAVALDDRLLLTAWCGCCLP